MQKRFSVFFVFSLFFLISHSLFCTGLMNFGSRNSALKLSSGSTLHVSSVDLTLDIDGTLMKDSNAQIVGNRIAFTNGILESAGAEALMTAVFDPDVPDTVYLLGSASFDAEPGTIIEKIRVDGTSNRLEGQPVFSSSITFSDSVTTLDIAIQSKLNQNITLTGGTLTLYDDLKIADDVMLIGPGRVILNDRKISLGSFYSSAWDQILIWESPRDLNLTGDTVLTGEWVVTGSGLINGHGNVLDLTLGGTIRVAPGANLSLVDVHIRGIGDGYNSSTGVWYGKILMEDPNATIRIYNSDIEIVNNYTTTTGKVYIEGPSTFIFRNSTSDCTEDTSYRWLFNQDSTLRVDGVTLWIDSLDNKAFGNQGNIYAPLPVFDGSFWSYPNVTFDTSASGNLELVNDGIIERECCGSDSPLFVDSLSYDVTLDRSVFVHPGQRINIACPGDCNDIVIDGQGAKVIFAHADHSQFVVRPDCTVTLKNIVFKNITQNTFNMMWYKRDNVDGSCDLIEGKIKIAENVVFSFSEDVTFSQGLFELINSTVDSQPHVFYASGEDGVRNITFEPEGSLGGYKEVLYEVRHAGGGNNTPAGAARYVDRGSTIEIGSNLYEGILFKLSQSIFAIKDINLRGNYHFSRMSDTIAAGGSVGKIGQYGNSSVSQGNPNIPSDIDDEQHQVTDKTENVNIPHQIMNEGNAWFINEKIMILPPLSFVSSLGDHSLRIKSSIPEAFDKFHLYVENSFNLYSTNGQANLKLDDEVVVLEILAADAFTVGRNSNLQANTIEHKGYPVVNISGSYPASKQHTRSVRDWKRVDTLKTDDGLYPKPVIEMSSGLESMGFSFRDEGNELDLIQTNPSICVEEKFYEEEVEKDDEIVLKTIQSPSSLTEPDHLNMRNFHFSQASGNHVLDATQAINFSVHTTTALNLTLKNESVLSLDIDNNVTLKSGDIINVIGENNEIHVFKTLTINGDLLFDTNSELKIILENENSKVVFGSNLDLESNCELVIEGNGIVEFSDGTVLNFKGSASYSYLRPFFVLSEKSKLIVADGSSFTVKGIGDFLIESEASIVLEGAVSGKTIIFGNTYTDDILLKISGTGMISLGGTSNTGWSRISMHKAGVTILVDQGGVISLQDHGWLEINSLNSEVLTPRTTTHKGNVKSIILSPAGMIFLNSGGKISIADNHVDVTQTIIWKSANSFVSGGGTFEYKAETPATGYNNQAFGGTIQTGYFKFDNTSIAPERLVRTLVNQVPALSTATVYTDASGTNKLRLGNGKIVSITSGDVLSSEDGSGNVSGVDSDGKRVKYVYPLGTRK